jgi:hypothetical protein
VASCGGARPPGLVKQPGTDFRLDFAGDPLTY